MPNFSPTAPIPASTVDLDALYAPPAERIQKAVLDHLVDFHAAYLKAATFFCLATSGPHGLDASPRGGPPGFVRMLDAHTIAYADWPGNNRIESLRNLQSDERVGMLFLFPGLEIFMRINGRARIVTDGDLLAELKEGERVPKTATVVHVDEVLLHCGKAINRTRLWQPEAQLARCVAEHRDNDGGIDKNGRSCGAVRRGPDRASECALHARCAQRPVLNGEPLGGRCTRPSLRCRRAETSR